jgi:hypothetical protein
MSYLWKKWREAVEAKDWAMASAYADMLDDERGYEKVPKPQKTIWLYEYGHSDTHNSKRRPLWLKENDEG